MKNRRYGGLSDEFAKLNDALVFPHVADNSCGVLDASGAFCEFSRGVMGPRRATTEPEIPPVGELPHLKGRYLYGGWLRAHFGHFLLESTSRLWALDKLGETIDGIIFVPFRRGGVGRAKKQYSPFLDILSGGKPIRIVREPSQVDTLFVPDPGFGHHYRMCGSPRYRAHTRAQVAATIKPEGPERLYVSRSALMDKRGGVLAETRLEALLQANGYTVFHPQQHSIAEQLAHYRAARYLVSLDGSALHMAAYALQPDARVAMVLRRQAGLLADLASQIELFTDAKVHSLDALCASWVAHDAERVDFRSIGELDFNLLQRELTDAGFIEHSAPIGNLDQFEIDAILTGMDRGDMHRVPVGG
jgi:hypothetical protein